MHSRSVRTFLTIFLTVCVGILFIASPVGATSRSAVSRHQASQASDVVTSGLLVQDDAKVQAYWTPERMKSAHPADELLAHVNFSQGPVEKGGSEVGAPAIPQVQHKQAKNPYSKNSDSYRLVCNWD